MNDTTTSLDLSAILEMALTSDNKAALITAQMLFLQHLEECPAAFKPEFLERIGEAEAPSEAMLHGNCVRDFRRDAMQRFEEWGFIEKAIDSRSMGLDGPTTEFGGDDYVILHDDIAAKPVHNRTSDDYDTTLEILVRNVGCAGAQRTVNLAKNLITSMTRDSDIKRQAWLDISTAASKTKDIQIMQTYVGLLGDIRERAAKAAGEDVTKMRPLPKAGGLMKLSRVKRLVALAYFPESKNEHNTASLTPKQSLMDTVIERLRGHLTFLVKTPERPKITDSHIARRNRNAARPSSFQPH